MVMATELSVMPMEGLLVSVLLVTLKIVGVLITVANDNVPVRVFLLHFGVKVRAQDSGTHIDLIN
jgi:hypothetical protein